MTTREKILSKQPLSDEEIRQLFEQKKEYLILLYLGYCPLFYEHELLLFGSGMKKVLRKQVKKYGLTNPEAQVALMKLENIEFIKILIKEQMVCREAEIALKNIGSEELNGLYRRTHRFFKCEL
jgi:hypothetical protein